MTHLYARSGGRAPVRWEPEDADLGKQAVESVIGSVKSHPVEVDAETADQIRDEYRRLVEEQTSGGSA